MKRLGRYLKRPAAIGLALGLIGATLTVIGLFTGGFAPPTARNLFLGVLLGGGSWGVIAWAIASAVCDAESEPDR